MKKYNKGIILMLSGAIIFTAIGFMFNNVFAKQSDDIQLSKLLTLEKGTYIIAVRNIDWNNDGHTDTIALYGDKQNKEDNFIQNMNVAMVDGKNNAIKKSQLSGFYGYGPEINICDFTGDGKDDVQISAETGGSSGASLYAIIDFSQNMAKNIFPEELINGLTIDGNFIDDFIAEINIVQISKKFILDVSVHKERYIENKTYNRDGKCIAVYPFIFQNAYSMLEPTDYDGDGVFELIGKQRLVGDSNANAISNITSTLKYNNGNWDILAVEYSTYLK